MQNLRINAEIKREKNDSKRFEKKMPLWWNWQTRGTQNPVVAIPCRFDPDQRHHIKRTGFIPVLCIYCCFGGGGVRGDLSPSFVNLPLRQISAEGIPLLRETAVPESCRPAAPYKKNGIHSRSFYILLRCQPRLKREA